MRPKSKPRETQKEKNESQSERAQSTEAMAKAKAEKVGAGISLGSSDERFGIISSDHESEKTFFLLTACLGRC